MSICFAPILISQLVMLSGLDLPRHEDLISFVIYVCLSCDWIKPHMGRYLNTSFFFLIYFFIFRLCHVPCGILVPRPGFEPGPPAVEAWSLNHWTTRGVPKSFIILGLTFKSLIYFDLIFVYGVRF